MNSVLAAPFETISFGQDAPRYSVHGGQRGTISARPPLIRMLLWIRLLRLIPRFRG